MKEGIKVFILILGIGIIGFSCGQKKLPTPPISVPTMSSLIVNLELAETYSTNLGHQSDSNKRFVFLKNPDSLYLFYSSILKHYEISFGKFNEAITWYKDHPKLMDSLMTASIDEFNRQTASLNVQIKPMDEAPIGSEQQPELPVQKTPKDNRLMLRPKVDTINPKDFLKEN